MREKDFRKAKVVKRKEGEDAIRRIIQGWTRGEAKVAKWRKVMKVMWE